MSALGIALLSLGLLAAGAAIGFYLARLGQSAEQAKLDEVESEFDTYREQVTEHFAETASRFTAIGQQYRELYDHLAAGSEALCLTDKIEGKLPFPPAGAEQIAVDEADDEAEAAVVAEDAASDPDVEDETPLVATASEAGPEADAPVTPADTMADTTGDTTGDTAADTIETAKIDSADEPSDVSAPDEAADGEAGPDTQPEVAAAAQPDAEAVEPLEGEIVNEETTVKDNVVELVPRSEAREEDPGSASGTTGDGDDKRTYH